MIRPHGGRMIGMPSTFSASCRALTPSGRPRMKFMSDRSGSLTSPRFVTSVFEYW